MKSRLVINLKKPWFTAALLVAVIPFFPEYLAPILAACSLIAAHYDAKSRKRDFQVGLLGKMIIIYIAYMLLGVLYSKHALSTLATVGMWAVMFMSYMALTTVLYNRKRLDTFILMASIIAGVVGLIGCVQYMLHVSLGLKIPVEFWGKIDNVVLDWFNVNIKEYTNGKRVFSTFNNPNIFAEYMVMALPFVTYYSIYGQRKNAHLICRFFLMASAGAIAFSFSRGSYMGLLAVALIFGFANMKKIALVVITIISGLFLVPQAVIDRLLSVAQPDSSISERVQIWALGTSFFKENPLFGIGAGISNSWDLLLKSGVNAPHMHNLALQLLIEGGIIALIIFLAVGWNMVHFGISVTARRNRTHSFGVTMVAFSIGFFICGMVDFPVMTPKLVGMFMTALAFSDVAALLCLDRHMSPLTQILNLKWHERGVKSEGALHSHTHFPT